MDKLSCKYSIFSALPMSQSLQPRTRLLEWKRKRFLLYIFSYFLSLIWCFVRHFVFAKVSLLVQRFSDFVINKFILMLFHIITAHKTFIMFRKYKFSAKFSGTLAKPRSTFALNFDKQIWWESKLLYYTWISECPSTRNSLT